MSEEHWLKTIPHLSSHLISNSPNKIQEKLESQSKSPKKMLNSSLTSGSSKTKLCSSWKALLILLCAGTRISLSNYWKSMVNLLLFRIDLIQSYQYFGWPNYQRRSEKIQKLAYLPPALHWRIIGWRKQHFTGDA